MNHCGAENTMESEEKMASGDGPQPELQTDNNTELKITASSTSMLPVSTATKQENAGMETTCSSALNPNLPGYITASNQSPQRNKTSSSMKDVDDHPTFFNMQDSYKALLRDKERSEEKIHAPQHSESPDVGKTRNRVQLKKPNDAVKPRKQMLELSDVAKLLSCSVCQTLPITSLTAHMCHNGHVVCGTCFGNGNRVCDLCGQEITCKHEVLEEVLQRLRQVSPNLFPKEKPYWLTEELQDKLEKGTPKIIAYSSRRPVDCPHQGCFRLVACYGLMAHFQFEHTAVPVFQVGVDCSQELMVPVRSLASSIPRVLAVSQVYTSHKGNLGDGDSQICSPGQGYGYRRDVVVCVLMSAMAQLGRLTVMLIWCGCIYEEEPPMSYRLSLSTSRGGKVSFQGPMVSLYDSQDPASVLQDCQCLLVGPQELERIARDLDGGCISMEIGFTLNVE